MTAKEYLSQARTLDMRIKSKLQQIESLNELATSCTVVYSDMPRNPNRGGSKVERAVLKIIEVEESLKHAVEDLVELKKDWGADEDIFVGLDGENNPLSHSFSISLDNIENQDAVLTALEKIDGIDNIRHGQTETEV